VLGFLFDLERGRSNRWMHRLQGVLETALGRKLVLPERKLESMEQFLEQFPEVKEVILDGTERPVQRPKTPTSKRKRTLAKRNDIPASTSPERREKSE